MRAYRSSDGSIKQFEDTPLSKGGEGAIYKQFDKSGHGDVGDLAKIFHDGKSQGKEAKIKAMLSISSPTPSSNYAWPKEILYDVNTGAFCGYVMFMKYNMKELGEITPADCHLREEKTFPFFVSVAKNLAHAVAGLHSVNQVIGDLNDKNVLVDTKTTQVTIIDNDSFHISTEKETHRCCVGMGEYIAPEIQKINFREAELPTFTKSTDVFSLAVLIFKLLMNGLHPFYSKDGRSFEDVIRAGYSPFFENENKGKSIEPFYAPPIELLPAKLSKLFKSAFSDIPKKRPTAQDFYDALDSMSSEESLEKCALKSNHIFPKGLSACPWCYVEDKRVLLSKDQQILDSLTFRSYQKDYKKSVSKIQVRQSKSESQIILPPAEKEHGDYLSRQQEQDQKFIPAQPQASLPTTYINGDVVPPDTISHGRKAACVAGCIGVSLFTIIICAIAYVEVSPVSTIVAALVTSIMALDAIPKLSFKGAYNKIVEFPDYYTVKIKERKEKLYVIEPKTKVILFTFLVLSTMVSLGVATAFGNKKGFVWPWISFSMLSIVATFYITDKRTLWTKTVLGIILGIFSILTIILSIALFANRIPELLSLFA